MPGLDLFDLTGKRALITGASRGMGLAMACAMGHAGAAVVIAGIDAAECDSAAEGLLAAGIDATGIVCDVADKAAVEALAAQATAWRGGLDILVCNAGIAPHVGPLASASDDDWDRTMTVNLRSMLWLTGLVIPGMAAGGGGAVILTASLSSVRGNKSIGLYGISKAGVAQLARNLAVEWGPQNIRVNAMSPGVIRTEFARPMLDNDETMARRIALTPLRRVGEPEEVAGLALLLASKAGGFITGQNLIVDGGTTISDGN